MAKLAIAAGSTSQTVNVFIQDSSKTDGSGLTGLVYNTASLTAYYVLPKAASAAITLATLAAATSAWSSGGFKEIDATNCPGLYRLDLPDAVLANGRFVNVFLRGATNMAPCVLEIELTAWNNQDGVRGGMTALPNAAAEASGGLITRGTSTGQLSVSSGQVIIQAGTAAGQLDFTSGVVKSNVTQYNGSNATSSSGRPEVNITHVAGTILGTATAGYVPVDLRRAGGSSTPVNNFIAMFDGTGYAGGTIKLGVDTVAISGDAGAADNAESFFDGTGYAGTNNVIPRVTLVDTCTANTDMVAEAPTADANAQALLKYDMSTITGEADRSPLNAIRFLRNKWSLSSNTLTVTKEDDTTTAWTATVSTDAAAVPVIGSDPA